MKKWIVTVEVLDPKFSNPIETYGFQVDYVVEVLQHEETIKHINEYKNQVSLTVLPNPLYDEAKDNKLISTYP